MGSVFSGASSLFNQVAGAGQGAAQALTPQNNYTAQTPLDIQNLQGQIYSGQQGLAQNQAGQSGLASALLAQSQGQGANPAQQMLNQATNQSIQQNSGLIASQKGISPALAARAAAQGAATQSQQAAGQGAVMGAQQQLGAQQALGNLYGQQANENLQNISTSGGLANNSSLGSQGINAGTSAQNAAANQSTNSGLLGGVGSILQNVKVPGMAHGGVVERFAAGGSASSQIANQMMSHAGVSSYGSGVNSQGASKLSGAVASKALPFLPATMQPGADVAGQQGGAIGAEVGSGSAMQNAIEQQQAATAAGASLDDATAMAGGADAADLAGLAAFAVAHGGTIPSHLHHIAMIYHPQMFQPKAGTTQLKANGGPVPGKANVKGDSPKNDTVKTMLSPGEIVIPRSIVNGKNPEEEAASFVAKELAKQGKGKDVDHKADFKSALKSAIAGRTGK